MKSRRFFLVMVGLLAASILLIFGATLAGNSLLQKQAQRLNEIRVESKIIEEQETALLQAKRDIEKYEELDEISKTIVPRDKDQAITVLEITNIARESGITLSAITFPASSLGQKPAAAPSQPAASEGESGGAPAAPKTPPITQVSPVSGLPGVYALEIVINSTENRPIPYSRFISFLERLESNRRTAHVVNISLKPTPSGDSLSFVLTLNAYVKPEAQP